MKEMNALVSTVKNEHAFEHFRLKSEAFDDFCINFKSYQYVTTELCSMINSILRQGFSVRIPVWFRFDIRFGIMGDCSG